MKYRQKKVPNVEVKQAPSNYINLPQGSFLEFAFSGGGYITAAQAMNFYRETAAVATAVDMIAENIEQIRPVVQGSDEKFTDRHPVLDLLTRPNGFHTYRTFIGKVARNYLLKHDSFITAAGNRRRPPLEIWPVSLQNVSILQSVDDYPREYRVTRGMMPGSYIRDERNRMIGYRFYDGPLKELYHIRGFSSRYEELESDSPLQAAALEARQIIRGKYHNLQLLNNGGRLSLFIAFNDEDDIDDGEHRERIRRINEQLTGPSNAGKAFVASNADISEFHELGTSNKDMDFATLDEMASFSIYLRYKIPLALVTINASTFNNLATGIELLFDNAVLPLADTLFSDLSRFLLPRYDIDPTQERITYDPESINALRKRILEEVKLRREMGIETINELRSLIPGRESIEGGDVLYQAANQVPVGTDLFTDDNDFRGRPAGTQQAEPVEPVEEEVDE